MNPTLLLLASLFAVKRTDNQSDEDHTSAIVSAAQKAQEAATAARADAADKARLDGGMKAVTDMFKAKLKGEDGFSEDLPVEKMADMMGKAFEKMKGERDAAKKKGDDAEAVLQKQRDDAARADLKALVAAKRLQVEVKDDAALPTLRRQIAEALVGKDRLKADASDDYITGILDTHRPKKGEDTRGDGADDDRYRHFTPRKDEKDGGSGNDGGDRRRDAWFDPSLAAHDAAFKGQ